MTVLEVAVIKTVRAPVPPGRIRDAVRAAAGLPGPAVRLRALAGPWAGSVNLTVKLAGDRELRRLERAFFGEDHTTDVLSFPAEEPGYLGDIAVSWPQALRQAAEAGHDPVTEVLLLCVHGFLHLLGYDHGDAAAEQEMWQLTLAGLGRAGVEPSASRLTRYFE